MEIEPDRPDGATTRDPSLLDRLEDESTRGLRREYNITGKSRRRRMAEIIRIARRAGIFKGQVTPKVLRRVLEELGPTFVKMGQILSMRSEILPQRYCDELAKLRTNAEPMPFDLVLGTLREEYGRPLDEVFSEIDPKPLGSASLAQVHRATLVDGRPVAVKVQRPHVQETMVQDIDIMRSLARRLTTFVKTDQIIDINQVVEELWVSFREETDFLAEARNLVDFHEFNRSCVFVDCPEPLMELCTQHVVVMDYVDGISISHPDQLVAAGYDLDEIGTKLVDNYATQVLDDGFFHADPHPGNIMVSGGKIMYIDLGMVGRLSAYNRSCMADIIAAVGECSSPKLKDALLRFAISKDLSGIDHAAFLQDLDLIVEEFGTVSLQDLDLGSLLFTLIGLARKNHVELPPTITMMARGFVTLEGVLDEFVPNTNMLEIIRDHIKRQTTVDEYVARETKDLLKKGHAAVHGALDATALLGDLAHMLTRGEFKMNMEMLDSKQPINRIASIADRLTLGIIIAGLFIGSSIVYCAGIQPVIFGIPVLGFLGYAGALILSVYVIVSILRTPGPRS